MINNMMEIGTTLAEGLYKKVTCLSRELTEKNFLEKCTDMDKKKISSILNEIKYDATRIKNLRFIK